MATPTVTTQPDRLADLPCQGACSPITWPRGAFVCSAYNTHIDGLCSRHWGHDGDHIECTKDGHAVNVWSRTAARWIPNPAGTEIPEVATPPAATGTPPSSPEPAVRAPGAPITPMTCCGGYPGEHFAGCRNEEVAI